MLKLNTKTNNIGQYIKTKKEPNDLFTYLVLLHEQGKVCRRTHYMVYQLELERVTLNLSLIPHVINIIAKIMH